MNPLNPEVSQFLDELNHPLRGEIEQLRHIIINAQKGLTENVKWNGPNYTFAGADRITMKIQPPRQIQLIFHRGARKMEQPKARLIESSSGLLAWKENDRAIATFKNATQIKTGETSLVEIVKKWIAAAQ